MFYKQFSDITNVLNPEFVENFDYWLTTLPSNNQKNITISAVSTRFQVSYSQAKTILKFAEKQEVLESYYLAKCPKCGFTVNVIKKEDLKEMLIEKQYCGNCEEIVPISLDDIYIAYKVIKKPDASEEDIAKAIEEKLNQSLGADVNFTKADSLADNLENLYKIFYNPSESAYQCFCKMKEKLDLDYKKNTTAKGNALEKLILEIFKCIKGVKGTTKIKTGTNQLDCTMLCNYETGFPSVFNYLSPYFIIECKNEKKKPDNTYCEKLFGIIDRTDAKLGIIFGRKDATSTCFQIAREHYLTRSLS